jgi:hypothetical protein
VHSERTTATGGSIDYSRNFVTDTANKVPGTTNLEVEREILFDGGFAGQLSSTETMVLSGNGQFNRAKNSFINPFVSTNDTFIPPFCTEVETGSDLIISSGSFTSVATNRFVSASSDYPVEADYDVRLVGIGGIPADGKISAYMQSSIAEGMVNVIGTIPFGQCDPYPCDWTWTALKTGQRSEIEVKEHTSIDGKITLFEKDMHFESGAIRV